MARISRGLIHDYVMILNEWPIFFFFQRHDIDVMYGHKSCTNPQCWHAGFSSRNHTYIPSIYVLIHPTKKDKYKTEMTKYNMSIDKTPHTAVRYFKIV